MNHQSANIAPPAPASPIATTPSLSEIQATLAEFVRRGGPQPEDYPALQRYMDTISAMRASGEITDAQNDALWDSIGDIGTAKTLMGFIYRKPHGYHGDFQIIDKFYTRHVCPEPSLRLWDEWIQSLGCTQAVRNRKSLFISLLLDECASRSDLNLLNVGSGPCRDVSELLQALNGSCRLTATCVDLDHNAIDFATSLLGPHQKSIRFLQQNVLRLRLNQEFDIAWSAGLFDYLNDRLFIAALQRMYASVRPGGKVVIGNFAPGVPSRTAMEWGNWCLKYRTSDDLKDLVLRSELSASYVEVRSEPLGVNLFVVVQKPEA